VRYDAWEREGLFQVTTSGVIDYRAIRSKILELRDKFDIAQIYFDRWNSTDIVTNPGKDAATKRLLELVLAGELAHDGNRILRWMASNGSCYRIRPAT
jgi:phage terminase large subunit-like protein